MSAIYCDSRIVIRIDRYDIIVLLLHISCYVYDMYLAILTEANMNLLLYNVPHCR